LGTGFLTHPARPARGLPSGRIVSQVVFRPALPADADSLAPRLRAADLAELVAAHGPDADPLALLRNGLAVTPDAVAAVQDGRVIALLGCAPAGTLMTPCGIPWLLGSDECSAHARLFVARGRQAVGEWLRQYGRLENYVDARHVASLRWLRRLGFTIQPVQRCGPHGALFHRFTRCT
jgi:hypothetical protein